MVFGTLLKLGISPPEIKIQPRGHPDLPHKATVARDSSPGEDKCQQVRSHRLGDKLPEK